jgi:hypothetical protein
MTVFLVAISDQTPLNLPGFWRMANCPIQMQLVHQEVRNACPIGTGLHAPTEIEVALTNAFDNGIKMVKAFINGALTEGNNADFYSPISR